MIFLLDSFNIQPFNFFSSPLEQFVVHPIFLPFIPKCFFLVITDSFLLLIYILFTLVIFIRSVNSLDNKKFDLTVLPRSWQDLLERLNLLVLSLVMENVKVKKNESFVPFLYCIFLAILILNFFGLIPYSFTLTSHLVTTFTIALMAFIGTNIIGVKKHGIHYFSLFLPPGTPVVLSFLLVPIEFFSYLFKPISLSIRLFANMVAGHTLLKVTAGFAYTLMSLGGFLFFLHFVPVLILIPLFALECAVALIQTYVFSVLICIYIDNSLNLH
jgi:ATP synthase subunit 6